MNIFVPYILKEEVIMKRIDKELLRKNVIGNLERDLEKTIISGASVIVAQHGEILLDERIGYKNPRTKELLPRNTIFRLASMTKPVTAVAALMGVERGWFSLDDKITDYYPEIGEMYVGRIENDTVVPDHKPENELLLYQLLSHNSGLMGESPIYYKEILDMPYEAFKDNKTAVDYCLKNTRLTYEPKVEQGYCGYFAFDMIALLIEKNSCMKYADFVKENILDPLGINDITYHPTEEQWSRIITMTDKMAARDYAIVDMVKHNFESFPLEYTCAGAGLVGSIEDYFIFAEMLRRGGEYNGVRILKSETLELMKKAYVPEEVMGDKYTFCWGLGVRVSTRDEYLPNGSFGWSGAYGTHFWIDPENDITAIYMKNSRWHDAGGGGQTGLQFEQAVIESLV